MIRAVITDIEGTTSSISFVKDVLFPYAAKALPDFVRANRSQPAVQEQLRATANECGLAETDTEALIAQLLRWMREDKKITPLKSLQGMVWQQGYEQGAYKAHVYPDAVRQLRAWHAQGLKLFVYSSGSIHAQKLFFKYSDAGDLSSLFSNYFDTTTGPKQETGSYRKITAAIGLPAGELVFLSDIGAELDAAREAGLNTVWLVREKDSPLYPGTDLNLSPHQVVTGFSQIRI